MKTATRRFLQSALFLSGVSSLVLEVAWSRALSLSLGNSHQAVATVVASMMAGLWAGSLLASRCLPRLKNPAAGYGLVEMMVGGYAALTPWIFNALPLALAPLYEPGSPLFASVRFLVVFLALLPASAGMGATLPLVAAGLARTHGHDGSVAGRLYGLNTLGAFLGTMAGGFVLLPGLGLQKTILAAAGSSLVVGLLAWRLTLGAPAAGAEGPERPVPVPGDGVDRPRRIAGILPLYACSGALAMVYEIMWTRALSPIIGTSVYSFTLILAAILAGIGLGSVLLSTRALAPLDPGRGFVIAQSVLASVAYASAWGLRAFPDLVEWLAGGYHSRPAVFLVWEFVLLAIIVLPPGIILGALFPLAARLVPRREQDEGVVAGRVYSWNTAGSIAGALVAGFLLLEALGSHRSLVLASAASALLALAALPLAQGRRFRAAAGTVSLGLAIFIPFLSPAWDIDQMTSGVSGLLRGRDRAGSLLPAGGGADADRSPDRRVVFHREGRTATVTVVRDRTWTVLRVDGKSDASTHDSDMQAQVLLGQIPLLFAPLARDVCLIGFGSGVTAHAVLTHPVRRLDTVEIEPQVIAAGRFFENVNLRPLGDPRTHLILEDARTALQYRPQTYDVIISEPSNPWIAGVNNLFTTDFYRLVRRRLNPGGILCQWVQFYELSERSLQTLLDSLAASFAHTHLFLSSMGSDVILLASDRPLAFDRDAAAFFPDRPEVARDLARVGLRDRADLALIYTGRVPPPAAGGVLNTDDNSLIQYRAPLEMLRRMKPERVAVESSPDAVLQLFFADSSEADALQALARSAFRIRDRRTVVHLAGLLEQSGHTSEAVAVRRLGEDLRLAAQNRPMVDALLDSTRSMVTAGDRQELVALLERVGRIGLDGQEQFFRAGSGWAQAGRYTDAERCFDQALSYPSLQYFYGAHAGRGSARFRLGRPEEGIADLELARAFDPDRPLAYLALSDALASRGETPSALRVIRDGLERIPGNELLLRQEQILTRALPGATASPGPPPRPPGE
jgi:spermidine synthase